MAEQYPELWIIEPKEATNLITNPSIELATTNWGTSNSAVARVATYQRRGVYSLAITPNANAVAGTYFSTVTLASGTTYTFSVDVLDVAGQGFNLYFANTSGTLQGTATEWTGTGHWTRRAVSWTCNSNANYRLYLTRDSVNSTSLFYLDGAQCESGAESTYFDGDSVGFNPLRKDYCWNGTAHASTSYRSAKTRTGGTLLRVRDYAKILGISGMGMPPVENAALPVGKAGSQYQSTRVNDREMTVYLRFYGATTDVMRDNRHEIADALKMDNIPEDEPVILRWRLDTSAGVQVSEVLDLAVLYGGGLEDDTSEPGSQIVSKAAVQFTAYNPFLALDGEAGASLGFIGTLAQSQYAVYRSASGQWYSLGSINAPVYAGVRAPSGSVILGGAFSTFGGGAGTGVVSLSGTTKTQVGAGIAGTVYALAANAAGSLFAGGQFSDPLKIYDGSIWTAIKSANAPTLSAIPGTIYALTIGDDGTVYAAGKIGTADSITFNNVGRTTGVVLGTLSTGIGTFTTDTVYSLAYTNNNLYAGALVGTAPTLRNWATGGTAWGTVWTGAYNAENSAFGALGVARDGRLYQGVTKAISRIVGTASTTLYRRPMVVIGTTSTAPTDVNYDDVGAVIHSVTFDERGACYLTGDFAHDFSSNALDDSALVRRAGAWVPLDIDTGGTVGSEAIRGIVHTPSGEMYMYGAWTAAAATTASVTACNSATARAYPRVAFTGPGKVIQLVNYTTGRAIYFNGLTLQAGEYAIFDLRPGRVKFFSNWRANLMRFLAPGADLDFFLIGGSNNISAFMTGTDANSKILMSWQPVYWGVDGAMW